MTATNERFFEDFAVGQVCVAEEIHHFSNILRQRHSVGVGRLMGPG